MDSSFDNDDLMLSNGDEDIDHKSENTSKNSVNKRWQGVCLDDGTGHNVYYVDNTGYRSRKVPPNVEYEYLSNGERRYYYRGRCIRCKNESPSVFVIMNKGTTGFSCNYCKNCLIAVTPGINKIRGNGDLIWKCVEDVPKIMYRNLKEHALLANRDDIILDRCLDALLCTKLLSKKRRDDSRTTKIMRRAREYGVFDGGYKSWGFDFDKFDEYYGEMNDNGDPHGLGVKWYNDGSIYCGEWKEGNRHTSEKGLWTRQDGTTYEGNWFNDLKHGKGEQVQPNGSKYVGEFAKGFEHGHGILQDATNGSTYEGRYVSIYLYLLFLYNTNYT